MTLKEANFEKVNTLNKNKKCWIPKRIFLWFLSIAIKLIDLKNQKISELITNWILLLSPIALLVSYSIAKNLVLNESSENHSEELILTIGTYGFIALMSIVFYFSAITYKFILRVQKKKGVYWNERHAKNRGWT